MKHLFLAILLLVPVTVYSQHGHAPAKEAAPATLTAGLGDINHPVSTNNAEAQKFFNQGLAYLYGFNHEEAVRSCLGTRRAPVRREREDVEVSGQRLHDA